MSVRILLPRAKLRPTVRALRPETLADIAELHRLANDRSLPARNRAHLDTITSTLQAVAEANEPLAIPHIISLTLDIRREIAEAAGQAVKTLRHLVAVRDLSMFDQAFRQLSPWTHPDSMRWIEMQPNELATLAALRTGPTLIQLAMCHPSGYVREQAIRRSATSSDGSEVGFLLLRANDWVQPVRDLAQSVLRARLTSKHVPDLVVALPMLDDMRGWGRLGSTKLVEQIEHLLRGVEAVPALIDALHSRDRLTRRSAYRRLFERDTLPALEQEPATDGESPYRTRPRTASAKHDLFAAALRDGDPVIRAWAGHWLIAADDDEFAAFAEVLLRSRSGAVRLGAASRLVSARGYLPWSELLLDPHGGVRALAQQAALDAGKDPDTEYRARVASSQGARLGIALIGLGETGGPADAALVRGYLRSDPPVVRKSALHALASFKVDDIVELAIAALRDESSSVARAARDLLIARIGDVRGSDVWTAFTSTRSPAGTRAALDVLSSLGPWDRMPYLIRAYDAGDEASKARSSQHLTNWIVQQRRVWVYPSSTLADEIRELVAKTALPDGFGREILGILEARLRR